MYCLLGLPRWLSGKEYVNDAGDVGSIPGLGLKTPWKQKSRLIPVFLPGKFHGQRSLAGYSPWGCKRAGHTA